MTNKKYWTNITAGATFAALVVSASAADPQLLLDFQFNEGHGLTSASSVGSTVLTLGQPIDLSNDPVGSTDSPSGKAGDLSGEFNGIGWGYGTFDAGLLDLTKPISWEAWVNVNDVHVNNYDEYLRVSNTFKIGVNQNDYFEVTFPGVVDLPTIAIYMDPNYVGPNNGWVHVAAVWIPGDSVTFYQDGTMYDIVSTEILDGDGKPTGKHYMPNAPGSNVLSVGSNNSGGNGFQGKLDRMRLYNRALDESELDSNPANPRPIGDAILAWDFDQEALPFIGAGSKPSDLTSGLAVIGDRTQIAWSDSTPARDADPTLVGDFSVFVDNKGSGNYANKYGVFDCDTIDFGDTTDASFSLEAWFKGLSKSDLKQVFFQTWSSTTGKCPRLAFAIYPDFTVYITTMAKMDIYTGAKIPEDGGWHHIACTFDQPNKKLLTYVDGKLASDSPKENNASGAALSQWGVDFSTQGSDSNMGVIGAEHSGYAPFTGYVDRMRFWKGVLPQNKLDYVQYKVLLPPTVVKDPENVVVPSNITESNILLHGEAVGDLTLPMTYQWYRNGEPIEGGTDGNLFVAVTDETIGTYHFVASNDAGTAESEKATIAWGNPITIGSSMVLNYEFPEGPGNLTTASSVGNVSAVLGTEYDPAHHPSTSADSPSGIAGDNAVVFDGTGYLRGWTEQLYDLTQPFTMETWVYIDPDSTKGYEGFATYGQTLKIGCTSDHYFVFTMSGVEDVKSSIPVDPINGWQHLAAAWTPGVGVTFYFNGMEWETIETTNMPRAAAKEVINGGEVYRITVGAEAGGNPTQGMLDRVRVHQAVLTADQLDSDPANPKPVRADTLFAFDFNKETEMPYTSTTTPVIVLNEDPAEGATEAANVQWSEDSPVGKEGDYSLSFNGSAQATMPVDYLQFNQNDPSFTIEAWVKGAPQTYREIIFSNNGQGACFSFSINNDYSVAATLYSVDDLYTTAMIPQDGKWHHVAFCYDYTDSWILFYVDGKLGDVGSYSGKMSTGSWANAYIGSEGGNYYKGNLDRLRVHTGVLDPQKLDYYNIDRKVAPTIVSVNLPAVVAGEEATLSVEVTGSEPMTYQWFHNDVAIEGANAKEYTIEAAQLTDAGAYTVKVTNSEAGVTSDPETLVVTSAPGSLVKLVDFQMDERTGNTTASTVSGAVATWSTATVVHSTDTPSGITGDYSVEFAGNGFLIGDLGNLALPLDKGFTWESWVYRAEDGYGTYEDFIRIGNSIKVGLKNDKQFEATFLGVWDYDTGFIVETGKWYHLAAAWEPGVGIHFYVNGEYKTTVERPNDTPNAFGNTLMTLAADNGGGCKFWGKLDRTRVHLGVLTAEELDCEAANPKPVTENTIFDYQFNEILTDADGDEYFDSVGQADVAEYIYGNEPATWVDGPYGVFHLGTTLVDSALKFDGGAPAHFNTDGIDFGDTTDLSYSMEAWVKDVPATGSRQVFFQLPGNAAGTAPRVSFSVGANHTIYCTALGVKDYDTGVVIPTDSDWHHIALAFNLNAKLVYVYLDGQLAAAQNYTWGLSLSANSNKGALGAEYNCGLPFKGSVDRVKLWKGVLGPESMDYPPAEPLAPVPPVGDLELSYSIEGADLVLRWAAETGASLEVAPTADSANWTILQGELVGGAYQCKVPMTEAAGFYRLVK